MLLCLSDRQRRDEWTERLRKNLSVFLFSKQFQFLRKINKCSWAVMWFVLWWHSDDIVQSFSTSAWVSIDTFPVNVLNEVLKTTWDRRFDLSGSCGSSRRPASSSLWGTTRRIPAGGSRQKKTWRTGMKRTRNSWRNLHRESRVLLIKF